MAKIFIKTFVIGVVILINNYSFSQVAVSASGGSGTGTGGSAEFSLGQVLYLTNNSFEGLVIEGIQVPYEIFVITSLPETPEIDLYCSVYPNPTNGNLTLRIENTENELYSCQLFDMTGKILNINLLHDNEAIIEMENQPAGIYLLKVQKNQKEIKTFRIIKN